MRDITMAVAVGLRLFLLSWFMMRNGWLASSLALSECLALFGTVRGALCEKLASGWIASLPALLYLVPLLLDREGRTPGSVAFVAYIGLGLMQAMTALYMGFHLTIATPMFRGLLSHGPFGVVRHPSGTFGMGMCLAFAAAVPTIRNIVVCVCCLGSGVLITIIEERFLRQFPAYISYCQKVPYRFIPGFV